jgi:hypothetical protein
MLHVSKQGHQKKLAHSKTKNINDKVQPDTSCDQCAAPYNKAHALLRTIQMNTILGDTHRKNNPDYIWLKEAYPELPGETPMAYVERLTDPGFEWGSICPERSALRCHECSHTVDVHPSKINEFLHEGEDGFMCSTGLLFEGDLVEYYQLGTIALGIVIRCTQVACDVKLDGLGAQTIRCWSAGDLGHQSCGEFKSSKSSCDASHPVCAICTSRYESTISKLHEQAKCALYSYPRPTAEKCDPRFNVASRIDVINAIATGDVFEDLYIPKRGVRAENKELSELIVSGWKVCDIKKKENLPSHTLEVFMRLKEVTTRLYEGARFSNTGNRKGDHLYDIGVGLQTSQYQIQDLVASSIGVYFSSFKMGQDGKIKFNVLSGLSNKDERDASRSANQISSFITLWTQKRRQALAIAHSDGTTVYDRHIAEMQRGKPDAICLPPPLTSTDTNSVHTTPLNSCDWHSMMI